MHKKTCVHFVRALKCMLSKNILVIEKIKRIKRALE